MIEWLIFAHFLSDWGLQSTWMSENKRKYFLVLFAHSIIVAGVCCIPLILFNKYLLWKFIFLLVTHLIIDKIKCLYYRDTRDNWTVYVDQIIHILLLSVVLI